MDFLPEPGFISNPQPWVILGFKSNALSIRPRLRHCEGGISHPPPMCSIDATAAILHQNALHTPAYWWRGDSDEANQCMEMIRRP